MYNYKKVEREVVFLLANGKCSQLTLGNIRVGRGGSGR